MNWWFPTVNETVCNVTKIKYSFFHKTSKKDDITLRENLSGESLNENLSWKDHIKYTENKISKNIGILFKARDYLSKESLLSLYYAYIHTYVNYANLA